MHQKQTFDYNQMSNIPKKMIEKINERATIFLPEIVEVQTSKIDGTQKFLFQLQDHHMVESVLMKYKHGNSVCISTQVGCKMGCKFCASTLDGWIRNLTAGEMLAQVDSRTQQGHKVSPPLLLALLFGEYIDDKAERFRRQNMPWQQSVNAAVAEFMGETCPIIMIANRVGIPRPDIISQQLRL